MFLVLLLFSSIIITTTPFICSNWIGVLADQHRFGGKRVCVCISIVHRRRLTSSPRASACICFTTTLPFVPFFFVFSKWIAIFTSAGHCSLICFSCFLFFFVLYDRNGFDDCGFIQGALLLFRLFCAAAVGFTGAHGSWLTFPSVTGKGDCFSWLMDGTCG